MENMQTLLRTEDAIVVSFTQVLGRGFANVLQSSQIAYSLASTS
jgi:hypothetical protein